MSTTRQRGHGRLWSPDDLDEGLLWGYALLVFGCSSFAFFLCAVRAYPPAGLILARYAYVAAPFMPDTGYRVRQSQQRVYR